MEGDMPGIIATALVGVAGILSTHLLARSQRKAEATRVERERSERYRFAEYQTASALCADYLAELQAVRVAMKLRITVTGAHRRSYIDGLSDKARRDADESTDSNFAEHLRSFANRVDDDPRWAMELAKSREADHPPAIDTVATVRRLTDLSARIAVVGGSDLAAAAKDAQRIITALLLRLQALELTDFDRELPLDELDTAILRVEEAAIYQLRLLPHGEKATLDELRAQARADQAV